jgi:hypothetical protein
VAERERTLRDKLGTLSGKQGTLQDTVLALKETQRQLRDSGTWWWPAARAHHRA